ncbi:hypothetical protein [Sulfitobacter sp.]|uniref:hypothetical protein n=1 Tax=Sulfitobacter sp. TaxID=1903071 RepID=UPI00356A050B
MTQTSFVSHYNNTLLSGLSWKLLKMAFTCLLLMTLFLPSIPLRHDHEVAALALSLLSLCGAVGVVMIALAMREIEKKRVQL